MDLFSQLEREQKFSASLIQAFEKKFGDRFFKALEKLDQQKQLVIKYIFFPSNYTIWVIQGQKDKYIIYPDVFCECKAFLLESIYRKKKFIPCKHLVAQKIAQVLNKYQEKRITDKNFSKIMNLLLK